MVQSGGADVLWVDLPDLYRRAAVYVGQDCEGHNTPARLPLQSAEKFELVVKPQGGKLALGLTISESVPVARRRESSSDGLHSPYTPVHQSGCGTTSGPSSLDQSLFAQSLSRAERAQHDYVYLSMEFSLSISDSPIASSRHTPGPIFSPRSFPTVWVSFFELLASVLLRRRYLLLRALDIAILLCFRFIAADDLDDFLNLRQCRLRRVWRGHRPVARCANAGIEGSRAEMTRTCSSFMTGLPTALLVSYPHWRAPVRGF